MADHYAFPLAGKTAIVTGASRGIGAGIAFELAKRGASVVITYTSKSSEDAVKNLISKIEDLNNGARGTSICTDLRDPASPGLIAAKAVEFGRSGKSSHIDILVNNAGIELVKRVGSIDVEDFEKVFHLNVRAPVLLMEAVLPHLPPTGGSIINLSSVGARAGFPGLSLYCSSKAAIEGLTRCWAAELGAKGTRVNSVNPGPVDTEMIKKIPKEIVDEQKKQTPLENRIASTEDIALIVCWLAGQDSRWVTGQVISASGGYAMY
ncbi:MAG: hypothetical protein M1818_006738 [Claussenomyces sp. TS43310]|nr:MAG: hypothetical protein M1818_006738 [Claussenomyces sp. TS43310]